MDVKKRALILAFLGAVFSILGYLLLALSRRYSLYIYLAGLFTKEVVILLAFGATICFGISIRIILKYLGTKYLRLINFIRVGSFLTTAIAVLICFIMIFVGILNETHRFVLKSPDEEHTIIVTESSFLLYGGGAFYEKVNPIFAIPIGGFTTDDGYRPFTNDEYTVEWFDDGLRIKYRADTPQIYDEERLYYQEENFDNYLEGASD